MCARVHFSLVIVQQKTRFNDKFSLRQVLCSSSLKKEKECTDIVCNPLDLHTLENGECEIRSVVGYLIGRKI